MPVSKKDKWYSIILLEIILLAIIIFQLISANAFSKKELVTVNPNKGRIENVTYYYNNVTDWKIFMMALVEVESENNPFAVGKTNDGGALQITPIYIKEVNRIQDQYVFTLEDRFDLEKSIRMFCIMNDVHNKSYDIELAIKLHNPMAPSSYRNKIMRKIEEIKKREVIRQYCFESEIKYN